MLGETEEGRRQFRETRWEEQLRQAASVAGIDLAKLGPRKSDPCKVELAAVMKAATAVTNGWLCERLGMGTPASVSQFVRRWLMVEGSRETAGRLRTGWSKVRGVSGK